MTMAPQQGMAAAGRIEELIVLTERLTALIAEQAQAFEAGRPQDAAKHLDEITLLANIYRKEAQAVREQPEPIAAAPRKERHRLVRATEAFDAVIARQGRALNAAKTVTEGLVHAIAEEIASQRTSNAAYGPAGSKPRKTDAATAVTLNKRA
ncbi:MAG TPA: flagellar basal body protein [Caulobacteraceae bacterium]|nr:flagellar basal body protein [Caulobacteraceae bacterium]